MAETGFGRDIKARVTEFADGKHILPVWYPKVLSLGEQANRRAQKMILPRKALAQEFTEAERSPEFRSNGTSRPRSLAFQAMANNNFADYRLEVGGLVESSGRFSLADRNRQTGRILNWL